MKKLMITACAVALAAVVNAGTFNWGTSSGQYIYHAGTTTKVKTSELLTAYLVDANSYSQDALLKDFLGTGIKTESVLDTGATSASTAGKIAEGYEATPDKAYSLYLVVVDDDNVFISETKAGTGPGEGKSIGATWSTTTASKAAALEVVAATAAWSKSGWYTAAASPTPEPTTGLLMLVGLAGLALRRKMA